MFLPARVFLNAKSKGTVQANEIIRRIRSYSPNIKVRQLPKSGFSYPKGLSAGQMHEYMKQTVIISKRSVPFIGSFASPGEIVEKFTTVCNLSNMCCSNCEYCYLQNAQCKEHYIYTNRDDLEGELATSSYAHWSILTVWSMYSFGIKAPLLKLPPNLMEVADNIRKDFVRQHIVNNQVAIDYIYAHQSQIHTDLGAGLSESEFKVPKEAFTVSRDIIEALFHQNRKHPLRLTVSEFADIFAIDHLTGNLSFLMQMLEKYPDLNFTARTKSANVDEMVMYNGFGRVSVNMGLNTQHVIDTYEHGTSSLEERIEAAVKIQKAKGIDLGIIIEPMIMYEGCEEDYTKLIDYTMLKLDPTKIKSISIGSVRYRPQLRSAIQKHFPNTTLFDASQQLQNPAHDDKRYRYPVDVRVRLYSMMRDRIAQYTNAPVKLGAENPEVWEKLGMSSTETIGETVFQYSPNVTIPTTKERKKIVKKMKEPKRVKRMVKEVAAVVRERMMKGVKEKQ